VYAADGKTITIRKSGGLDTDASSAGTSITVLNVSGMQLRSITRTIASLADGIQHRRRFRSLMCLLLKAKWVLFLRPLDSSTGVHGALSVHNVFFCKSISEAILQTLS
jgi:hypothetical protein